MDKLRLAILPFIVIFVFSVVNVFSQETMTLRQCLTVGLENNYDIRLVKMEQQIAENNVSIGNAGYLPTLDLGASYSGTLYNSEYKYFTGGDDKLSVHNQTANIGLNLDWLAFDGFSIQTNFDKLKELRNLSDLQARMIIENYISQLTAEYYNFVQQNIRLSNLASALALSRERLRIVEARYDLGNLSRLDLQQAKADFNADSSRYIQQIEAINTSRVQLLKLMAAKDFKQTLRCNDTTIAIDTNLNEAGLWERTLEANAELLVSAKNKNISELDADLINSRNYPYLRLNAGYGYTLYGYNTGTYEKQSNLGLTYGITLGYNLFNGLNDKRAKENAQMQIEQRQLEYEQLEQSLSADFARMWLSYRNNIKLVGLERENLKVSQEYYDAAIERYKLGDLSGIELREAQNSLLEAEERLLTAEYNTKMYEISLLQISGGVRAYLQ